MIQGVCSRIGEPRPQIVAAATDDTIVKLRNFANEVGIQLALRGDWRLLRKEKTFTSLAQEIQTSIIPSDWLAWIDGTFWNRNKHQRLWGPATPQEWQDWKGSASFPVNDVFYARGSDILLQPTPVAGQTFAFEYISDGWCQSSGAVKQNAWAADTDTGVLPERLLAMGTILMWKQDAGEDTAWIEGMYEREVHNALGRDSPRRTISLKQGRPNGPGWTVPEGSWPL